MHLLFCQVDEDISAHKAGSNKKSRKAGFGSLFDKRTSDKMDETEVFSLHIHFLYIYSLYLKY